MIDSKQLSILQENPTNSVTVTKFYYFVCSSLSKCVYEREKSGWSRNTNPDDTKKQQQEKTNEEIDENSNTPLPLILQNSRREFEGSIKSSLKYLHGDDKENIGNVFIAVLEDGLLHFYASEDFNEKPVLHLDLLVYSAISNEPESNSFSLINDQSIFTFEPLNDTVTTWTNRLLQTSYAIQTKCLEKLSPRFFIVVCTVFLLYLFNFLHLFTFM